MVIQGSILGCIIIFHPGFYEVLNCLECREYVDLDTFPIFIPITYSGNCLHTYDGSAECLLERAVCIWNECVQSARSLFIFRPIPSSGAGIAIREACNKNCGINSKSNG